jgi:hypothetical protein
MPAPFLLARRCWHVVIPDDGTARASSIVEVTAKYTYKYIQERAADEQT